MGAPGQVYVCVFSLSILIVNPYGDWLRIRSVTTSNHTVGTNDTGAVLLSHRRST